LPDCGIRNFGASFLACRNMKSRALGLCSQACWNVKLGISFSGLCRLAETLNQDFGASFSELWASFSASCRPFGMLNQDLELHSWIMELCSQVRVVLAGMLNQDFGASFS
ncbi:27963_t:CDS:2, partial [Racocetra persica]